MNKVITILFLSCFILFNSCGQIGDKQFFVEPTALVITEEMPEAMINKGEPFVSPCDGRFLTEDMYSGIVKSMRGLLLRNKELELENEILKKLLSTSNLKIASK